MADLLHVAEAAEFLGVHAITIRRLSNCGLLRSRRDYRNHRVFDLADLIELKARRSRLEG